MVGVSRVGLRHGETTHHKFYNVDQLDAEHLWSDGVNRSEECAHVAVCSVRGLNAVVVRKRGCSGKRSAHEGKGVTRRGASFELNGVSGLLFIPWRAPGARAPLARIVLPRVGW